MNEPSHKWIMRKAWRFYVSQTLDAQLLQKTRAHLAHSWAHCSRAHSRLTLGSLWAHSGINHVSPAVSPAVSPVVSPVSPGVFLCFRQWKSLESHENSLRTGLTSGLTSHWAHSRLTLGSLSAHSRLTLGSLSAQPEVSPAVSREVSQLKW